MFLVVFISIAIGFLLIALLVFAKPSKPAVEREGRRPEAASSFAHLTMEDFKQLCLTLVT